MLSINQIVLGDCRELAQQIPDSSIDLIFTDPPYVKKFMYLYDWLSDETQRILKPDGFLLTYVGPYWKDVVMAKMSRNWQYYFDFILLNSGNSSVIWTRKVISRHKSIVAYRKPEDTGAHPRKNVLSFWVGSGRDKRFHTWGQDESSARYYIDCFSKRGDLIFDPFCGGGTTPAVCKIIGRNFITCDVDPVAVETARARVSNSQMVMDLPRDLQTVML
jgi:site-specific DNA-methyltransferase (adenine-specific)